MQRRCMVTEMMSLRHLKTDFFHLAMNFKKKKSGMSDKSLRDWVKVGKKSLDRIQNEIQYAKNNNLQARPKDIKHSKIIHEKALKIIIDIHNDIKIINDLDEINRNQVKVLNALLMVDEIFNGELKCYKLTDDECKLLRSKGNQKKSDLAEQKFDIKVFK